MGTSEILTAWAHLTGALDYSVIPTPPSYPQSYKYNCLILNSRGILSNPDRNMGRPFNQDVIHRMTDSTSQLNSYAYAPERKTLL